MLKAFLHRLLIFIATAMVTLGFEQALAANENLKIPNLGASSTSLYSEEY